VNQKLKWSRGEDGRYRAETTHGRYSIEPFEGDWIVSFLSHADGTEKFVDEDGNTPGGIAAGSDRRNKLRVVKTWAQRHANRGRTAPMKGTVPMKLKKCEVFLRVSWSGRPRSIEEVGELRPWPGYCLVGTNVAVHRGDIVYPDKPGPLIVPERAPAFWSVTHLPTGLSLFKGLHNRDLAVRYAEAIYRAGVHALPNDVEAARRLFAPPLEERWSATGDVQKRLTAAMRYPEERSKLLGQLLEELPAVSTIAARGLAQMELFGG